MTLALIDYGAGNLRSVENALRATGCTDLVVTADADVVARADRIVLPGVGAFGACARALRAVDGMIPAMGDAVHGRGVPFLGVCVGMQLLATRGEEYGVHAGLDWIGGTVAAMAPTPAAKVPHMGWNDVVPDRDHPLLIPGEAYFLHGYRFAVDDPADRLAITDHGGPVTAAVARGTVIGVQFHPEKSQAYGLAFLSRFLEWRP
ncbi:MAG TPA: imidazole glycerol phosphate synthase subunit HisH [Sphingomonas sp.]|jgi:glutamine amidotransferase|uniref:imidazole glycerol phosphate synthase subunit HisH n=1 Tax=Sphingomonas sp. TaxID=28214 RepID=UPI002ED779C5